MKKITSRAASFFLAPAVLFMTLPAYCGLPNLQVPTGGAIGGGQAQNGDILGGLSSYLKLGLTMLGLVLASVCFYQVVIGALAKWRDYTRGQAAIGDLKEFIIMGVVLVAFVVLLVKYALETIA